MRSLRPLLVLLCLGWISSATGREPPAPAPKPTAKPRPDLAALSVGEGELVQLNLANFDVRDVLAFYERLSGRRLVLDSTIQGQINLVTPGKVTKAMAVALIETSLLLNGYTLVDRPDERTLVLGFAKNARGAGIPIFFRPEDLPASERVVSLVFKFRHRNPLVIQQLFQRYVTANLYTSFVADPGSRTLLVTESASTLRQLAKVVDLLDTPEAARFDVKNPPPPKREPVAPRESEASRLRGDR
ncbi:MAG: hypothetical protein JSR82_00485 [Verrucomicrobia bacterium]|nr:hypothetical protein [Verrucomicrobiota bacterium]